MRNLQSPSRYSRKIRCLKMPIYFRSRDSPCLLCDSNWFYDIVRETFWSTLVKMGLQFPVFNGESFWQQESIVVVSHWQKMAVIWSLDLVEERPSIVQKLLMATKITSCDCSNHCLYRCSRSPCRLSIQLEGAFDAYIFYSKDPEWSWWIAKWSLSSTKTLLLASGIADGLTTWVKARAVMQANGKTMLGRRQTLEVSPLHNVVKKPYLLMVSSHGCLAD